MKNVKNNEYDFGWVTLLIIVLGALVLMPYGIIWSLNYLFLLNIEYSIGSFVAVLILKFWVFGSVRVTNMNELKEKGNV